MFVYRVAEDKSEVVDLKSQHPIKAFFQWPVKNIFGLVNVQALPVIGWYVKKLIFKILT